MLRWLRDIQSYLRDRKRATLVVFVYPESVVTGADIKYGRFVMGDGGRISNLRMHLRDDGPAITTDPIDLSKTPEFAIEEARRKS